jgi:hypothetical protein
VTFPSFETYAGIPQLALEALLAHPDTTVANLAIGLPPVGFTFVDGDYTLSSSTASPASDQFGVLSSAAT